MTTTRKRTTLATPVNAKYGAPMGRSDYTLREGGDTLYSFEPDYSATMDALKREPRRFRLQDARLDSGGYDHGGAYWGHSKDGTVYLAESDDGRIFRSYRAKDRAHALAQLRDEFPKAYTYTDALPLVRVIFRAFKDGEVIALFPDLPGNVDPSTCAFYAHVGQHGHARADELIAATRPAREPDFIPLKRELESAPFFYALQVCKRIGPHAYQRRRDAINNAK